MAASVRVLVLAIGVFIEVNTFEVLKVKVINVGVLVLGYSIVTVASLKLALRS